MKKNIRMTAILFFFIFIFIGLVHIRAGWCQSGAVDSRTVRNVDEARGIALTNTLLPIATGLAINKMMKEPTVRTVGASLVIYGLIMGPSSGNFYANDYLRGGLGAVSRAGIGSLLLIDSTRELLGKQVSESLGWDKKSVKYSDPKLLVGSALFLGTVVYNFLSAEASVRDFNKDPSYAVNLSVETISDKSFPALSTKIRF